MEVLHENNSKNGKFYILADGQVAAEMTYVWAGDKKFIIDHTEVGEQLKGMGAGKQMVAAAVAYAREHQLKIMPLCPFAKSVFDKTVEYSDVLS